MPVSVVLDYGEQIDRRRQVAPDELKVAAQPAEIDLRPGRAQREK
jgi:hypothetical protein